MRRALLFLAVVTPLAVAQPRIDNVLIRMVPTGTTSLAGARMDQIKATEFYRKLLEQSKLPQLETFATETGFDPRRDVRELLFASTPTGGVLLARGSFQIKPEPLKEAKAKLVRHGEYNIYTFDANGFCVLDQTLAAAGDVKSVEAALDEWTSGSHTSAAPLLAHAKQIDPKSQFWGVSTGFATFLADNMPRAGGRAGGIDFSKIFRGLEDTSFQAEFTTGFKADLRGSTATEQDAVTLRDTAKGLIGFGRLSVPENQSEMLKLWDGITVEQDGKSVGIRADIAQNLIDKLVQMLSSAPGGRGRGPRTAPAPPKL
jgi:hypothetical protein